MFLLLLLFIFSSMIPMIIGVNKTEEVETMEKKGWRELRLLALTNKRHKLFPSDLLQEISASLIDDRCDAQILFESIEDPNERLEYFGAKEWQQIYNESRQEIASRLNGYWSIEWNGDYQYIIAIENRYGDRELKSFNMNHLKNLRNLQTLDLYAISSKVGVPDLNGWSDELIDFKLVYSRLADPAVEFTGFPKKLETIKLICNGLEGDLTLPKDVPDSLKLISIERNPKLKLSDNDKKDLTDIRNPWFGGRYWSKQATLRGKIEFYYSEF